jgi:predicted phage-related endonuclease
LDTLADLIHMPMPNPVIIEEEAEEAEEAEAAITAMVVDESIDVLGDAVTATTPTCEDNNSSEYYVHMRFRVTERRHNINPSHIMQCVTDVRVHTHDEDTQIGGGMEARPVDTQCVNNLAEFVARHL